MFLWQTFYFYLQIATAYLFVGDVLYLYLTQRKKELRFAAINSSIQDIGILNMLCTCSNSRFLYCEVYLLTPMFDICKRSTLLQKLL